VTTQTLFGRDVELATVHGLIDRIGEHGSALVIEGESGIGKSALLTAASRYAIGHGIRVLAANGVESEAHLPFAGLHQLLRPLMAEMQALAAPQRDLLFAILGMSSVEAPELYRVALAVLDLLSDSAESIAILLLVDDFHVLDQPTKDVLVFVARRLESDPIVLLIGRRTEHFATAVDSDRLPELLIGPLDEATAAALLDANAPGLKGALRRRLLSEAAGNPLALARNVQ
jgi:hypothetical protein